MDKIIIWLGNHRLVLFAVLIYVALCYWMCKFHKSLNLKWREIYLVPLGHVVIGWTCMWLMALLEAGFDTEKAAAIRLYGAIFCLPWLYFAWAKLTKRKVSLVMDLSTISTICGAISGRLHCFSAGCCEGIPLGSIRWPIRQAELVFYVLFIIIFAGKIVKEKTYGQVYPLFLMMYGTLRFASEFVREEYTTRVGMFHLAHIWSLIAITAGIIWYVLLLKHRRSPAESRKKTGVSA